MADGKNSILGLIVAPVIVALLVGGTAPWWWQEFFADKDPTAVVPSPENKAPAGEEPAGEGPDEEGSDEEEPLGTDISPPAASPPPVSTPQQASINLAYTGDYFGCNLPLAVTIDEQDFYPQGNVFQANGVSVGQQSYQISGQINCPAIGICQVSGQGTIQVIPGNTYYITWGNTAPGQCTAVLQ